MQPDKEISLFKAQIFFNSSSTKPAYIEQDGYIFIPYDAAKTKAATDPMQRLIFRKEKKDYDESLTFHVEESDKKYKLVTNITYEEKLKQLEQLKKNEIEIETNYPYTYVIISKSKVGEPIIPQLRIGKGNHYFVANENEYVLAAGSIKFNGELIIVDNQSGGYHIDPKIVAEDPHPEKFENAFKKALDACKLPPYKFESFEEIKATPTLTKI